MLPEVSGGLVTQVLTIETNLVVTFGNHGLVFCHHAIVSEERGDHVDKI